MLETFFFGELYFTACLGTNSGYISVDQYKNLVNDNSENAKIVVEFFQLAVNTIIYMDTFPNCVINGAPQNLKEEYSKKIEIAEKVINLIKSDTTRTVSPHSRRAYFKRLTSDFYTHKKGQTILVKETMVNGKAKTVYTANDLEKMIE